jgi:hypothetical protein
LLKRDIVAVEISNEKKSAAYGWNAAEDEQLRDFYVILYSRAAQLGTKFNIDPAKRYYPGCTGKLLLDRLRRCVSHHGDGPYFDALQQAWTDIWLKHRGKARLPDPHPRDYANFDLHAHRSYLCAKINKQSMYVRPLANPFLHSTNSDLSAASKP